MSLTKSNNLKSELIEEVDTKNIRNEEDTELGIGRAGDVSIEPTQLFYMTRPGNRAKSRRVFAALRSRHVFVLQKNREMRQKDPNQPQSYVCFLTCCVTN